MTASEGNSGDPHGGGADEPKTPMWLPALGAVLFLTVGLLWALSSPPKEAPSDAPPVATAATASAGAADGGAAAARP